MWILQCAVACALSLSFADVAFGQHLAEMRTVGNESPPSIVQFGSTALRCSSNHFRLAFADDGKLLTHATNDCLRVWDVETAANVKSFRLPIERFSHFLRGDIFVSANRELIAVDPLSGNYLFSQLSIPQEALIAVSPDRSLLAAASGRLTLWDTRRGTRILELAEMPENISHIVFSPDGLRLAVCTLEYQVRIIDLSRGKVDTSLVFGVRCHPESLAFVGNSQLLLGGMRREDEQYVAKLQVWNLDDENRMSIEIGSEQDLTGTAKIAVSSDGTLVATAHHRKLLLWDCATWQVVRTIEADENYFWSGDIALSGDNRWVATSGNAAKARVWEVDTGQELHAAFDSHVDEVFQIEVSEDGEQLFTMSSDLTLRQWNCSDGSHARTVTKVAGGGAYFKLLENEKIALYGPRVRGQKGFVEILDASGAVEQRFDFPANIDSVRVNPAGSLLVVVFGQSAGYGGGVGTGGYGGDPFGGANVGPQLQIVDLTGGRFARNLRLESQPTDIAFVSDDEVRFTKAGYRYDWAFTNQPSAQRKQPAGEQSLATIGDRILFRVHQGGREEGNHFEARARDNTLLWKRKLSYFSVLVAVSSNEDFVAYTHPGHFHLAEPPKIYCCRSSDGSLVGEIELAGAASALEFSPDSKRMYAGMASGVVLGWNVADLKPNKVQP